MKHLIRFNGHPVRFLSQTGQGSETTTRYAVVREDEATYFPDEAAARARIRDARLRPAPLFDVAPVSPAAEAAQFKRDYPHHGQPMRPAITGD